MKRPWDPEYDRHNENLRRAEAEWTQKYLTTPDEQDLRASDFREAFKTTFPDLENGDFRKKTGKENIPMDQLMLLKFREVAGYDPMTKAGEERFVEEHGFIPELVF